MSNELRRLESLIGEIGPLAVAVSGGVDSMTLAVVAHRVLGCNARMLHAVSPAVPEDGTARVKDYGLRHGWRLDIIDAREFADPDYMANPHDRCFYCKTNLYATMASTVDCQLVSGTNQDDLGDYRPGYATPTSKPVSTSRRSVASPASYRCTTWRSYQRHPASPVASKPVSPSIHRSWPPSTVPNGWFSANSLRIRCDAACARTRS